jgi:hypothetical protein
MTVSGDYFVATAPRNDTSLSGHCERSEAIPFSLSLQVTTSPFVIVSDDLPLCHCEPNGVRRGNPIEIASPDVTSGSQ